MGKGDLIDKGLAIGAGVAVGAAGDVRRIRRMGRRVMGWMRCPNCGREYALVRRVLVEGDGAVVRVCHCGRCGAVFETVEQVRAVVQKQVFQAALWSVLMDSREVGDG